MDVAKRSHSIGDNLKSLARSMHDVTDHRIPISDQITQRFDEAILHAKLRLQVEYLGHTQRRRLANIWVLIL